MAKYEALKMVSLQHVTEWRLPAARMAALVHLEDPAVSVMYDFKQRTPQAITVCASLDEAQLKMQQADQHWLLVEDESGKRVGLIASEDLLGEKPIQVVQERRVARSDLRVRWLMTPLTAVPAVDFHLLEVARVGNIVHTMGDSPYLLAVEDMTDAKGPVLRGLFLRHQLQRQLHHVVN
ncbi:MAG: hypothetical protein A3J38_00520 [Gammaproteobacteria bacterium RIFCSPHIGHO2_12_FULL_45_9]|nr:MAG: hypothetical protein A3J38_00520 [Gammaproteobacteria bacterium RIFCSPHIGHO2_12_FULL_45_9]